MFYAGTDLGKSFSYLTVVDEMGKVVRQGRTESTPEGLLAALSGLGPQLKVAMEATRACVPDPETRALRLLLRYRALLVEIRRAVEDRIHALLDRFP